MISHRWSTNIEGASILKLMNKKTKSEIIVTVVQFSPLVHLRTNEGGTVCNACGLYQKLHNVSTAAFQNADISDSKLILVLHNSEDTAFLARHYQNQQHFCPILFLLRRHDRWQWRKSWFRRGTGRWTRRWLWSMKSWRRTGPTMRIGWRVTPWHGEDSENGDDRCHHVKNDGDVENNINMIRSDQIKSW